MNAVTFPLPVDLVSLQSEAREKALGLRDLRYFLSVAHTGNLGRAARALNVSQPAISLQLRKLEEGLGTQLLLRHGRGVTLTPAGACLRDRLQTVMKILASPLDDEAADTAPQTMSIAVPPDIGAALVPPLVTAFRERWSDTTLDVRESDGPHPEEWVLHRQVDLAILQDPPALPELDIFPLLSEELGLIAPPPSRLVQDPHPLSIRELPGDSLILPAEPHWIRRRLDQAAQQSGARLNPVLQANSVALTKIMVRSGLGYTILPHAAVQDEITRGALVFRPMGQPALRFTRAIAFHRAASNSAVATFAGIVREVMTTLAERGAWPGAQIIKPNPQTRQQPRGHDAASRMAWASAMEMAST